MTRKEFAASIKAKYPQYKEVPDDQLVDAMLEKYPTYKAQVQDPPQGGGTLAMGRNPVTSDNSSKEPWQHGDDADWWGGFRKGLADYYRPSLEGAKDSLSHLAYPESKADFVGLLLPGGVPAAVKGTWGGVKAIGRAGSSAMSEAKTIGEGTASSSIRQFPKLMGKYLKQEYNRPELAGPRNMPSVQARYAAEYPTAGQEGWSPETANPEAWRRDAIDPTAVDTSRVDQFHPDPVVSPDRGSSNASGGRTPPPPYNPKPETATGTIDYGVEAPDPNAGYPRGSTDYGVDAPDPNAGFPRGGTTPPPDWAPPAETASFTEGPTPDWAQPRETVPTGAGPMSPRPGGKAPSLQDELIKMMEEARQPEAPGMSSLQPPADITAGGPTKQSGSFTKADDEMAVGPVGQPGGYTSGRPGVTGAQYDEVTSRPSTTEPPPDFGGDVPPRTLDDLMTEYDPGAMAGRAQDLRTQYGARDAARQMFGAGGQAEQGAIRTMAPGPSRTPLTAVDRIEEARRKANDPLLGMLMAGLLGHSTQDLWNR